MAGKAQGKLFWGDKNVLYYNLSDGSRNICKNFKRYMLTVCTLTTWKLYFFFKGNEQKRDWLRLKPEKDLHHQLLCVEEKAIKLKISDISYLWTAYWTLYIMTEVLNSGKLI